jgi:membrane protein YqaA with SNARE-associated domain
VDSFHPGLHVLNTLKAIFSKYTAFFLGLLKVLGIWGPFVIGVMDAAFLGIPLDPVVAGYVWNDPGKFWLYCLMATTGSAIGGLVPFYIGKAGGELLLLKHVDRKKMEKLRDRFEKQEFFFLFIPAVLPPPSPMKIMTIAAGVFEMRTRLYFAAVFTGKLTRFLVLSFLVIRFGPEVIALFNGVVKTHWVMILALTVIFALGTWLWFRMRKNGVSVPSR